MSNIIDSSEDIIDVQSIVDRVEELEADQPLEDDEDSAELDALKELLAGLVGTGGDVQFDGEWYPGSMIRDSYFETYARDLVEECGYIAKDFPSWIEVDWKATARNVRMDYTSVEFDGVTYWVR